MNIRLKVIQLKKTIKLTVSFLLCLFFASADRAAFIFIEQATPGIIGSILGGITAGIAVIFGILATLRIDPDKTNSFNRFLVLLEKDLKVLVLCLAGSILLPYIRVTGIPLVSYPVHELIPSRDRLITALELFTVFISLSLIIEVVGIMFTVIKISFKKITIPSSEK
ncbi:TPA: hypothetical protein PXM64_004402 [Yersinia enterocolitica]|nr:hypothetical protein [Yersinia enterocolitica]HDL7186909.1 hypothetical protein [Yersinia enterocolitica]HDL7189635.1 hypothetical protein [Yersinia enterocolitica]